MIEQEIERKLRDFRELGIPPLVPRECPIHTADRMVSTIVGARRAGKSFRAMQVAKELLEQGILPGLNHVCALDFDNPILGSMRCTDLTRIQDVFLKINDGFDLKTPLLFILDEIHKIEGWEQYVIDLSANANWRVTVTGSSSRMLRDDIATELRGKALSSTVFPLSFREMLSFKGMTDHPASTKGRAETQRHFEDYLHWGGFPAVVNADERTREPLLRQYFDTMILKDIIQRFNVSKPRQCAHLYNYLLSNIGKAYTLQSAYNFVKAGGFTTSRDSIRDYVHWAEDSWFLFPVSVYSDSLKEQERNYRKMYCVDWALANRNSSSWDGSYSRALENMVFIALRRTRPRVHYYLTRKKRREVDFITTDAHGRPEEAIQVCWSLDDERTVNRETQALASTARYFGTRENLILTLTEERVLDVDGISIHVMPAWKWMLRRTPPAADGAVRP